MLGSRIRIPTQLNLRLRMGRGHIERRIDDWVLGNSNIFELRRQMKRFQFQTPLAHARGIGSAKSGAGQWWAQRISACALAPLTLWFIVSAVRLLSDDHEAFLIWIASPVNAVLMALMILALFRHMGLGLQVIVDDYLHDDRLRTPVKLSVQAGRQVLATIALFAILRGSIR